MAEEFHQAGICGETWWNNLGSTRSLFPLIMGSTCSVAANDAGNNYSTNWQSDFMDLKASTTTSLTCADDGDNNNNNNNFVSNGNIITSLGFLDDDHNNKACESDASNGTGSILIDSTMQMMGFGSSNWNHPSLFRCNNGRAENNFNSVLHEETCLDSSCNNNSQQIQKPIMDQNHFSGGFPIGGSYGYNNSNSTNLMQSLYEPQTQNTVLFTNQPMSYNSSSSATTNNTSTQASPTWMKPSSNSVQVPKQQQHLNGLQFSNNTPFWNASAEALHDIRAGVFSSPTSQPQYQKPVFEDKPHNGPSTLLNKLKREESPDKASSAANKSASEPAFKRPRIETPSPLPTFKVRKEKLGDRITALQQLVSPFGKTDTASVLHEAIEYIKFLHDQVNVLSTPYMKNGAPIHHQQGGGCDNNVKESSEGRKQDLRSRGLCLVPISSTFPVASETTADFWTPSFGGTLIGR